MRIRLEVKEGEGRKKVIEGFGPPSRFNTIGRSHIYIRLFSGRIPADGIKPERSSKQPEILFHSGKEGSIERASVVFGGKVYHYDVIPENVLKGDAYRIFKALEALMKGNKEPLKKLAREWRGETEIRLKDSKDRARITLRIHAADIKDMLERHTHLKLGIERQATLPEFGIRIRRGR